MAQENNNKKSEEIKKLIIARLEGLPSDKTISIGCQGDFSKDELIDSVNKGDEIGEKITEIELEYLRSIKDGIFYDKENPSHQAET